MHSREQQVARQSWPFSLYCNEIRETGLTQTRYGVVTALYNVIWSYIGYSNANYALSETKNPVQTLKRAAPAALILVSILYMLVNVSLLGMFNTL